MSRRRKRFKDTARAGNSKLVPYIHGESYRARHARRLNTNLSARQQVEQWAGRVGLTFFVGNNGHHWKFTKHGFVAEWWPSTAKLVFGKRYREGIHVHDYLVVMDVVDEELRSYEEARRAPGQHPLFERVCSMGQYGIVIIGTGPHHGADCPQDADKMAHQFVNKLREAGHSIQVAQLELQGSDAAPEALQHDVAVLSPFFRPASPAAVAQAPAQAAAENNVATSAEATASEATEDSEQS